MWLNPRSKYCFSCGTQLRDHCSQCNQPITSIKFRFCPFCGNAYRTHLTSNWQLIF
ncbi:hypothetical protein C7B70_20240 [Chlorogloea sp. CCALA 695]|nr:hypothetical protein C7B70_20240 [Chlorogloea sp. CCALA 695]